MQGIYDIAEILAQNELYDVVLSPGSRCAPITNGIVHHPLLHTHSIIDERSAGFYALGMSLSSGKSSTLVCTSGSAGLNYAPAVAEAFFQEVPMLVLTADRPPELIDQYDGQTIFQENLFGKHVKKSFQTPNDRSAEAIHNIIQEAVTLANSKPFGPVHVNIPLNEPLYFKGEIKYSTSNFKRATNTNSEINMEEILLDTVSKAKNTLIVLGQGNINTALEKELSKIKGVLIIKEVHSNSPIGLTEDDFFNYENLPQPDLVITLNKSLISKNLKLYLRDLEGLKHIHIGTDRISPNTFNCLIGKIIGEAENVLPLLDFQKSSFHKAWEKENESIIRFKNDFFSKPENTELDFYNEVLKKINESTNLHFANSMAIRYGNLLQNNITNTVFCNRGTSGIDGSTSTAAGFA
jgi:2-succinyl-5-enolpyruvyl-6-hydroxy-3-cyclohexene-1-carboxylate synthase